ncbi:unnamed protein product [Rhodiola kirilowii]
MSTADVAMITPYAGSLFSSDYINTHLGPSSDQSILIYLALSGSMVPLRLLESDSIESVKLRIQTCKGFVMKNQKLICGGRELSRNDSLVRDYGVTDGNVLHLALRLSDLQTINVTTSTGKELTFQVEKCRDVAYVKQKLAEKGKGFGIVEDHDVVCNGEELEDQRIINDICKNNNAVIHLLIRKSVKVRPKPIEKNFEISIMAPSVKERRYFNFDEETSYTRKAKGVPVAKKPPDRDYGLEPIIVNPKIDLFQGIKDMIMDTFKGLHNGKHPVRSSEGTGGTYFMPDAMGQKFVSVFKPIDEEPMAACNPRGLPISVDGEGLKRGTRVGQGALREVAAYILDHPRNGRRSYEYEEKGFSGVPPTFMVKCLHRGFNHQNDMGFKIGSLQKFMENDGSCEDMGPESFPIQEVHKISVLDIRLANADRHAGNIMIGKDKENGCVSLIPIDHGYCLPESFEDCTFDWLYWPQARKPYSPDTLEYIVSLDAEEDIALLRFYGWDIPEESARTLRVSTMLLKKGAKRGLTPFDIGNIMCRVTINKESVLEEIVRKAQEAVLPGNSEDSFLESLSLIMDSRLDEIAK